MHQEQQQRKADEKAARSRKRAEKRRAAAAAVAAAAAAAAVAEPAPAPAAAPQGAAQESRAKPRRAAKQRASRSRAPMSDLKDKANRPGRAAPKVSGARASAAARAAQYASWGTRHVDTAQARDTFKVGVSSVSDTTRSAARELAASTSTNTSAFFKVCLCPCFLSKLQCRCCGTGLRPVYK